MGSESTKVNALKIRLFCFQINLISFYQTLVKMINNKKMTLLAY